MFDRRRLKTRAARHTPVSPFLARSWLGRILYSKSCLDSHHLFEQCCLSARPRPQLQAADLFTRRTVSQPLDILAKLDCLLSAYQPAVGRMLHALCMILLVLLFATLTSGALRNLRVGCRDVTRSGQPSRHITALSLLKL